MKLKKIIITICNKIKGFFPRQVPQGLTEFNALIDFIISTYSPPMDTGSVRFTVSALLQRLGPTEAYKSPYYFALSLKRGAAAQVGCYVMEDIKNEQRKEFEAAQQEAAKPMEATPEASNVAVSN